MPGIIRTLARCWILLAVLSSCQNTSPKPTATSATASGALPASSAAAGLQLAGPPPLEAPCVDYCKAEDPLMYRTSGLCGGITNHLMDKRHDTPQCRAAYGQLMRLWQRKPAGCECALPADLFGRGEATRECLQLCATVLPFYETMSGRCAGTPGTANYGNPECAPAAERFYDYSSSRRLDYCGCDSLTLHRRLMEQRGHIPASPVQ